MISIQTLQKNSISMPFGLPVAWGVSILLLLLAAAGSNAEDGKPVTGTSEVRSLLPLDKQEIQSFEGNWGKLDARELTLEPPESYIATLEELHLWPQGTVWTFPHDIQTVLQIFRHSGMNEKTIATLTSPPFIMYGIGRIDIRPPEDIILSLASQTRAKLYPHIGMPEGRNFFKTPLRFLQGGFPRLAKISTGLSPKLESLISNLSYAGEGSSLNFSDIRYVFSQAAGDTERVRIIKTLSREVSLQVWLDLQSDHDPAALISYWSSGVKNTKAVTLLEAALEDPGIERLDLVHLLPPLPKELLHTYPIPEQSVGLDTPDCYSTAFSFFSQSKPTRMMDTVGEAWKERYVHAQAPWQFGDVIVFLKPDGTWIHACNYVAGDIVFTKNGKSIGRPWVLQSLDEVASSYIEAEEMKAFFYRLKPEFLE